MGFSGRYLFTVGKWRVVQEVTLPPEHEPWLSLEVHDGVAARIRYAPAAPGAGIAYIPSTPAIRSDGLGTSDPTSFDAVSVGLAQWLVDSGWRPTGSQSSDAYPIEAHLRMCHRLMVSAAGRDVDVFVEIHVAQLLRIMGLPVPKSLFRAEAAAVDRRNAEVRRLTSSSDPDDGAADNMMVVFSIQIGGTDAHTDCWLDAMGSVGRQLAGIQRGRVSPVDLDLLVFVPGRIWTPDFQGVRVRGFAESINAVTGKISLPRIPPDDPRAFFIGCLNQAVAQAEQLAIRRHLALDLAEMRDAVGTLSVQSPSELELYDH